jgi:hypothetical protein
VDDRQERWVAADACTAGRMQKSCLGIVDADLLSRRDANLA